jgi:predicted XRE-type DNA-binding protein
MPSNDPNTTIRHGTNNIFADLGFSDPDTHLLKAQLVSRMSDILRDRNLTQTEAGRIMGISQPDVSRMLRGQFRDLSVERIMRMLTRLGCEVDIVVKPQGSHPPYDAIHLEATAA